LSEQRPAAVETLVRLLRAHAALTRASAPACRPSTA
jgi:hypothetical protein